MNILQVNDVVKRFGNNIVSNHISFDVRQGTIFGLLGPNGAGKTTLIRMICNIFSPDEGTISLFGQQLNSELQNRIGYLPEERGLYKKNKIIEQITYFGELKGMSHSNALASARKWLDKMGATAWENKKIEELSKGMQQKIQFISTVIHSPDFLILDEPFSGFDPVNTELLKNVILEMKSNGTTIILSTHIMSQVEEMCDEVCMINTGIPVLQGTVSSIRNSYKRNTIHLEYSGTLDFTAFPQLQVISQSEGSATLKMVDENFSTKAFISQINDIVEINKFAIETPNMHEIFIDKVKSLSN
ncbi:MAG: ATP-binding cassette domain-containing protein [Ignavibacteria bacterium]|jgi:ABC-2 type transport system ATP-binding protein|nr:ATP-binding cassette domain-containing protein [Ignavibacteria bacterium]